MSCECPRCSQGLVRAMRIRTTQTLLWVCEECEATWKSQDAVGNAEFLDYGTLMESKGLKPLWSELEEQ